MTIYGLKDDFFKEIDESIKKNCRNLNEMQSYLYMFQGFSQDLLTLLTNSMQVKLRIPAIFKNTDGEMPVMRLKVTVKLLRELKPRLAAIASMVR